MVDRRKPIAEAWEKFAKIGVSPTAGPKQRHDMQKTFYAGAYTLFATLMDEVEDERDGPTEDNLSMMDDVQADIREFLETHELAKLH